MRKAGRITFNFGIPRYKSACGRITCPFAGTCKDKCFAAQGAYRWPMVKNAYEFRFEMSLKDSFVDLMCYEIASKRKIDAVRVHDSGDFYSPEYALKWFQIARLNPRVQFYAYTTSVGMMKGLADQMPSNFTLIYSMESKQRDMIDIENDRHAQIFTTEKELKAAGYVNASVDDMVAATSENHKIGLILVKKR